MPQTQLPKLLKLTHSMKTFICRKSFRRTSWIKGCEVAQVRTGMEDHAYACLIFSSASHSYLRLELLSVSRQKILVALQLQPPWSPQCRLRQVCGLLPCCGCCWHLCSQGPPSAGKTPPLSFTHPLALHLGSSERHDHSASTRAFLHSLIAPHLSLL